jgi:glycosyltransferase involved in cell wall biosynthesis
VNSAHFGPGTVTGARVVALADQWRLSDGAPMVLVPGLTASQPQVRLLFRALESLAIPDLHCLILPPVQAGKEHAAALADQADRAGVGHIIHAVALCNDLPAAYMLADAVVTLPPWDVGFDWTAAEAQALGRPVVGPDSASLRELTVPGRTAWLAEDDKPATLAAALTRALALRGPDREALAEAAQDNIARVCDRRRFASGLAGLARDLSEGQLAGMEELADAEADSA